MVLGNTVELRNARIKLHNGYMRLIVDKWGLIETEHDRGNIEEDDIPDTNFSDIHHEE